MIEAKMLAIAAGSQIWGRGRRSAAKIIVTIVAHKFAGTRNAQMLTQLARENSAMLLKSTINILAMLSTLL